MGWTTQHVILAGVVATVLSVVVTLYAQSKIKDAIAAKAAELTEVGQPKPQAKQNPIKLMSALSSKKAHETPSSSVSAPPTVHFQEPVAEQQPPPKGAGSRWTPL